MLERVISGFQTGADQGGIRAAKTCGIPTRGFMPKWFRTEGEIGPDGIPGPEEGHPEFAEWYGAEELPTPGYLARTRRNARESDATIGFGDVQSLGSLATHKACRAFDRPILDVVEGETTPSDVVAWIEAKRVRVLSVAGNRESSNPGIVDRVARLLMKRLRRLHGRTIGLFTVSSKMLTELVE